MSSKTFSLRDLVESLVSLRGEEISQEIYNKTFEQSRDTEMKRREVETRDKD